VNLTIPNCRQQRKEIFSFPTLLNCSENKFENTSLALYCTVLSRFVHNVIMSRGAASFKVVLLGEGRVGKTSLCLQYVQNRFSNNQQSTIQATYLDKRINIGKQSVKLMIWDTAGQER